MRSLWGGGGYCLISRHRIEGVELDGAPVSLSFSYGGIEWGYQTAPATWSTSPETR